MTGAVQLKLVGVSREVRDRLELLTALIEGPGFDPLFRPDIIDVPRNHPALHWNCLVADCPGQIRSKELCRLHIAEWLEQEARGVDRLDYLRDARPLEQTKTWRVAYCCRTTRWIGCVMPSTKNWWRSCRSRAPPFRAPWT